MKILRRRIRGKEIPIIQNYRSVQIENLEIPDSTTKIQLKTYEKTLNMLQNSFKVENVLFRFLDIVNTKSKFKQVFHGRQGIGKHALKALHKSQVFTKLKGSKRTFLT